MDVLLGRHHGDGEERGVHDGGRARPRLRGGRAPAAPLVTEARLHARYHRTTRDGLDVPVGLSVRVGLRRRLRRPGGRSAF